MITRPFRRALVALAAVVAGTCGPGCSAADDEPEVVPPTEPSRSTQPTQRPVRSGSVELEVDLTDGGRWTMSGPLVEAGAICSNGYGRNVAVLDGVTHEPLDAIEIQQRQQALSSVTDELAVIWVAERRCADGSGTLRMEEDALAHEFRVVGGTGAYAATRGAGPFTWGTDLTGVPEWLLARLEIDLGPADELPS